MSAQIAEADLDLDALFDRVASEREHSQVAVPVDCAPQVAPAVALMQHAPGRAAGNDDAAAAGDGNGHVFQRLGELTRTLHDALRELGYDRKLESAAGTMPDARMRLEYIASLTGRAAETVLESVECAQALQQGIDHGAVGLAERWQALYAGALTVDAFKVLAGDTRAYLQSTQLSAGKTQEYLHQMMMAQDFHDLTGQVIKKIVGVAHTVETSLVGLLLEARTGDAPAAGPGPLSGPVIGTDAGPDTVSSQAQVDQLLDSLGF